MSWSVRLVRYPSRFKAWLGSATLIAASPGLRSVIVYGMERLPAVFHRLHDVQNGLPLTGAEVDSEQLRFFFQQRVEGATVPFREIHHVDVIPHAWPIWREPVTTQYMQSWSVASAHLAHNGEEVVGDAAGIFINAARGMGAKRGCNNARKRFASCPVHWNAGRPASVPPLPWFGRRD